MVSVFIVNYEHVEYIYIYVLNDFKNVFVLQRDI